MYLEAGHYDRASRVGRAHMSSDALRELYTSLACKLEASQKLQEAEQLYVAVGEFDKAILMYKKTGLYDQMLRLVAKYRKEHLAETYKVLGEQMELKGNLKAAEQYYIG
jgi:tetratricopeptide (TPR) repeat protein